MAGSFDGYEYQYHDTIKGMLDRIFESPFKHKIWYAHNGGRFDFLFILNALRNYTQKPINLICMGSRITGIVVKHARHKIEFRDSFALLPFSLAKLTKEFDVPNQKLEGEIDFEKEKVDKTNPKHQNYLKNDCLGLHQVLETFQRMPVVQRSGIRLTLASTALSAWRTTLASPLESTPGAVQNAIRESYAGGRCEIFKTISGQGHCYDVNSLYPTMLLKPLPYLYLGKTKEVTDYGFHEVEMYVPRNSFPVLWTKVPKLIFPTGHIRGTFFSEEIRLGISQGAKILRHKNGYKFLSNDLLFSDFVEECYALRLKYPNGPINLTAKLLMNTVYGKTGEREEKKTLCIVDPKRPQSWPKPPFTKWRSEAFFQKYGFLTATKFRRSPHMQVHLASAVTAWGRIHMAENYYIPYQDKIAYTDTDSIFITQELPESTGLGGLKREYSYNKGIFILPKGYYIETTENTTIRKLKGFNKKYINSLTQKEFEGKSFQFKEKSRLLTFREAIIRKNEFLATGDRIKSLKANYDKREVLPNGLTRPWHYSAIKGEKNG